MARIFGKYVLHCNGIDAFITLWAILIVDQQNRALEAATVTLHYFTALCLPIGKMREIFDLHFLGKPGFFQANYCDVIKVEVPNCVLSCNMRNEFVTVRVKLRLVKALEHHTMQPNALPDVQSIMLAKKLTRRSTRILTQSLQTYTALQSSLEKRMPTL